MQPYQLIQTVFAHDGPIRSVTYGPTENEIITGCQADAPNIRRWRLSKDLLQIEEIGSPIFHDHWVTALTSLKPSENLPPLLQKGCIITGCMDTKIRIFDLFNNLISTLEGHSKGVISFSWLSPTHLLSGSWDGLAILWDLNTLQQVRSFGPHENGVHVLGLSNGLLATTSTGESVNSQPANFHLRFWDPKTGQLVGNPIKDHIGPIRSIAALPGVGGFLTTSNDGSVIVRSIDGQVIETLMHPLQDDGTPPFVLDCNALGTEGGMDFVSSAEDGSVVVWQGTEMLQSIPHPNTIWVTLGLSETGEFLTGGQDGVLRIFSKQETYKGQIAVEQLTQEFIAEVETAKQAKKNGPSAEDLAKAHKWENRGSIPGKSEHQIMVFNRDNSLIAAEWVSGSWVFVGEVTGQGGGNNTGNTITASDSGTINDVHYDHVFPVEIETSQGLKSLQLGFNNLENPFMAAQRFIDQNGIGQYYLQQIADWIIARGGGGASSPKPVPQPAGRGRPHTQSFESSQSGPLPAAVLPAKYKLSYYVDGFAVFNDIPNITKVLNKLKEINQKLDELELKINENQFVLLEKLFVTLENTSYYHSSKISSEELITFVTLLHKWSKSSSLTTVNNSFIFYDMMRLFVLHPYCIELFHQRQHYQHLQLYLDAVDSILLTIHNHNYDPSTTVGHSVLVTMIKSFSNFLKNEITITSVILSNSNDGVIVNIRQLFSQIIIRFNHSFYFNYSLNKFNRLAMITLYHNLCNSLFIHKSLSYVAWYSALNQMLTTPHLVTLLQNVLGVVTNEKEMLVIVFRGFQIVNTALQYVGTVSSYPAEAVENVVVRQIRSNDGKLALMNGNNYWKEKEKSLELMKCFEEFIAL